MTVMIGLAGQAGVGKDTVADYLVERYGFIKFAFSDALYDEVQEAYNLPDQSLLRDRATKEVPTERLALVNCASDEFIGVAVHMLVERLRAQHITTYELRRPAYEPLSPRGVLQWWGTEYRRAQDPDCWVKAANETIRKYRKLAAYPEQRPQFFVNPTVRFENERDWVHDWADGNVWHIRRDGAATVHQHTSETPLPVLEGERELWNNGSIERLYYGVDLLLRHSVPSVRVEPALPVEEQVRAARELNRPDPVEA